MAGRCFMPDMPSLALSIIGLYFFQRWVGQSERARSTSLVASAFCISLSILIKLPGIIIGAPLAYLAFQHFKIPPLRLRAAFRNILLWPFAPTALLPHVLSYA